MGNNKYVLENLALGAGILRAYEDDGEKWLFVCKFQETEEIDDIQVNLMTRDKESDFSERFGDLVIKEFTELEVAERYIRAFMDFNMLVMCVCAYKIPNYAERKVTTANLFAETRQEMKDKGYDVLLEENPRFAKSDLAKVLHRDYDSLVDSVRKEEAV